MSSPVVLPDVQAPPAAPVLRAEWLALGSVLLASAGHLLIKFGLNRHAADPALAAAWPAALGLGIYGAGTLLWMAAVARAAISYLFPLSALSYALVALGGAALLGERVSPGQWAGIAVLSLGVALLLGAPRGEEQL